MQVSVMRFGLNFNVQRKCLDFRCCGSLTCQIAFIILTPEATAQEEAGLLKEQQLIEDYVSATRFDFRRKRFTQTQGIERDDS